MAKGRRADENPFLSLIFNVALPVFVLKKLSEPGRLDPLHAMLIALAFPLGYGIYDFARRRRFNLVSTIGVISVVITGGIWVLKLDTFWFAVKEAALPGLLAAGVLFSLKTKSPLVKSMLYNENVIDVARVDQELAQRATRSAFDRLLVTTSFLLASVFALSSVLNFFLARHVLKSPVGSHEFNDELGTMAALSWPIIALPSMIVMSFALWRLVAGIKRLTGLPMDHIFKQDAKDNKTPVKESAPVP